MPVLVEGISVIVRRDAIDRRYKGGWNGFAAARPNATLCFDAEIARIGFMAPPDVTHFVNGLRSMGFVFPEPTTEPTEIVVIDQRTGPTTPCDWIEVIRVPVPGGAVVAARLKGSQEKNLVCPGGWNYERSMSKTHLFVPNEKRNTDLELIGEENGVQIYRNKKTGEKVYAGRTSAPSDRN